MRLCTHPGCGEEIERDEETSSVVDIARCPFHGPVAEVTKGYWDLAVSLATEHPALD